MRILLALQTDDIYDFIGIDCAIMPESGMVFQIPIRRIPNTWLKALPNMTWNIERGGGKVFDELLKETDEWRSMISFNVIKDMKFTMVPDTDGTFVPCFQVWVLRPE